VNQQGEGQKGSVFESRQIDLDQTGASQLVSRQRRTYDPSGNRTKRQGAWVQNSTNAQYDELNQPIMWEQTTAGDVPYARTWYQYDKVGREMARWRDEQK
jgi:hypothetical protein